MSLDLSMRITVKIFQVLITFVGIAMFSTALMLTTAQSASSGTVRAVDLAADRPMVNPGATLDTTQVDDTRGVADTGTERADADAEGQDVLALPYDDAPADLWNSLLELHPEWYDEGPEDAPGHGSFYVPMGTDVPVPGGLYRAGYDGWSTCTDGVQECNAGSSTVQVDIPEVAPVQLAASISHAPHTFTKAERQAARLILARLQSHRPVFEDWTWQGMPRVVGAYNDALMDAAEAAGLHGNNWPWSSKARAWLSQVVRTGKG